jgi:DNA polymerase-1
VHDELVFEAPKSEAEQLRALVVDMMSSAYKLDVPLKVDAGMGENWSEAH